jgi:hypothetical protein
MIDIKATLKNLHIKFPLMTLDELFAVLDCVIEKTQLTDLSDYTLPKVWYTSEPTTCKVDIYEGDNQTCITNTRNTYDTCVGNK